MTMPADVAFPVPCWFLLRLTARKRTAADCTAWVCNVSEMTSGIGEVDRCGRGPAVGAPALCQRCAGPR